MGRTWTRVGSGIPFGRNSHVQIIHPTSSCLACKQDAKNQGVYLLLDKLFRLVNHILCLRESYARQFTVDLDRFDLVAAP